MVRDCGTLSGNPSRTGPRDTHLCSFFLLSGSRPRPLSIVPSQSHQLPEKKPHATASKEKVSGLHTSWEKSLLCLEGMLVPFYVSIREQNGHLARKCGMR